MELVYSSANISIDNLSSKTLDQFLKQTFDYVITVCDDANETCPVFYGAKIRVHWSIPDPSNVIGSKDERLDAFRKTREDITQRIQNLLD